MSITIDRLFPSGAWEACAFVTDGTMEWLERQTYFGYRKRDIAKLFREDLKRRELKLT